MQWDMAVINSTHVDTRRHKKLGQMNITDPHGATQNRSTNGTGSGHQWPSQIHKTKSANKTAYSHYGPSHLLTKLGQITINLPFHTQTGKWVRSLKTYPHWRTVGKCTQFSPPQNGAQEMVPGRHEKWIPPQLVPDKTRSRYHQCCVKMGPASLYDGISILAHNIKTTLNIFEHKATLYLSSISKTALQLLFSELNLLSAPIVKNRFKE